MWCGGRKRWGGGGVGAIGDKFLSDRRKVKGERVPGHDDAAFCLFSGRSRYPAVPRSIAISVFKLSSSRHNVANAKSVPPLSNRTATSRLAASPSTDTLSHCSAWPM